MDPFMKAHSRLRINLDNSYEISEEQMLKECEESIKSGLSIDETEDIFIKENYGALLFNCPENCQTIEDLLNYTTADITRKTVGKPTVKEKLKEIKHIITGNFSDIYLNLYGNYFKRLIDIGCDLVIGPGCIFQGQKFDKAVYCKNYKEILKKDKSNKTK